MNTIQVTDQIRLERLRLEHAPDVLKVVNTNLSHLRNWLPWLETKPTLEMEQAFIQTTMDQYQQGLGPHFAIFYDEALCGINAFHPIDKLNRKGSIGYWLAESHTGLGIMTLTTRSLLQLGFQEFGLHKIVIHCATQNHKSRASPERLGMKHEATLRDAEWLYDHYVDHAVYSMLESEFPDAASN